MLTLPDITLSVQVPGLIKDEFIRNGTLEVDDRNRPIRYAGGFAVVFPFVVNGEKWAFRCWSVDIGDIGHRLQVLSDMISKTEIDYLCDFTYNPEGIVVSGKIYPTTRMRWIDGLKIKDYICKHKNEKHILLKLADDFLLMCQELHKNKISHGDLQHGNILVDEDGKLYLIDYDSMFTPLLEGELDNVTCGLPDYQHPNRAENKYSSYKLDYFSELIIYISILAIAERPSLVDSYDIEEADRLLFSKEDFIQLSSSNIYKDLQSLSQKIRDLLSVLEEYLSHDKIEELGPFDFIQKIKIKKLKYDDIQYCTHCGTKFHVNEETKYCINCGKKVLEYKL